MSNKTNEKEKRQLGMAQGTARNRLIKNLMFTMSKRLGENYCFQCGTEIEAIDEFSIEHKTPWLDSEDPVGLYFDLENIAFSHHSCNIRAARQNKVTIRDLYNTPKGHGHCFICNKNKPAEEMNKNKNGFEGLDCQCKLCKKQYDKKRRS